MRLCFGLGWVMQMAGFLYIHRQWDRDQKLLANMLDYLRDIDYTYQVYHLIAFNEGNLPRTSLAKRLKLNLLKIVLVFIDFLFFKYFHKSLKFFRFWFYLTEVFQIFQFIVVPVAILNLRSKLFDVLKSEVYC